MASTTVLSLLTEAATLMLVGMVFVFAFLTLLILGVELIARFCRKFPGQSGSASLSEKPTSSQVSPSPQIVAAITAAVHTHRQSQR